MVLFTCIQKQIAPDHTGILRKSSFPPNTLKNVSGGRGWKAVAESKLKLELQITAAPQSFITDGMFSIQNPKFEIRVPKEIRSPKSESSCSHR